MFSTKFYVFILPMPTKITALLFCCQTYSFVQLLLLVRQMVDPDSSNTRIQGLKSPQLLTSKAIQTRSVLMDYIKAKAGEQCSMENPLHRYKAVLGSF